jgi:dolichol-phosphate mannosyltransferase
MPWLLGVILLLSLVFSFRNEEENIPELVKRCVAALGQVQDLTYEFIFVDDASTDNSFRLLQTMQQENPIKIVSMARRFGVGPCLLAGFAQSKGDAVVYLDADLQDPPELIPQLVEKYRQGADVVHTTRTHRDGESAAKMAITKMAYRIINSLSTSVQLPENTGDFKLLSRRAVDQLLAMPEQDPYMRGLAVWIGLKQEFVYYRREARFAGETHMPLFSKGPVREFLRGITSFSEAPLYAAFYLGLVTLMVAAGLSLYAVVTKLLGVAAPGVSLVLIVVAFFGGANLIAIGIIGLYVAKIYIEVKARPRYIVHQVHENSPGRVE